MKVLNTVMMLFIMAIILTTSSVTGVVFKLRNVSIPTDGSGRLPISDIDMDVRTEIYDGGITIANNDKKALLCHSTKNAAQIEMVSRTTYWYIDPEVKPTTRNGSLIPENENDRGWTRVSGRIRLVEKGEFYLAAFLKRETENATEGKFTCHIEGDSHNDKHLLILYPILSVLVSVSVDSESPYQFRIECTSTGGRALNMSITGPHGNVFPLNSIQAVGTQRWLGNDSYTGVGIVDYVVSGGYSCEASNGVSSVNDSTIIRVVNEPRNVTIERISPTEVRVEWSHPLGGVTVTGYVVIYNDGNVTMNKSVSGSTTSANISVFPLRYSIAVMSLSDQQQLPGISQQKSITIWSPEEVRLDINNDPVRVSWEAVKYTDYYTVSFSQTVGDDQEGLCKNESHFASVTVPATDRTADVIIPVGDGVEIDNTSVLRAFTTYSVKIVPFSTFWGESVGSKPINITTPHKSPAVAPTNLTYNEIVNISSIWIRWNLGPCWLVNGEITGFIIHYQNESENLTTNTSELNTILKGLSPSSNYTIRVAAENTYGLGPYSDPLSVVSKDNIDDDNGDDDEKEEDDDDDDDDKENEIDDGESGERNDGGNGEGDEGEDERGNSAEDGSEDSIIKKRDIIIAVGCSSAVIIALLISILLAVIFIRKYRRKHLHFNSFDPPNTNNTVDTEPKIVKFPREFVRVNEGERVVFDVRVEGHPRPQLTWYYDDREVVGTYSIDLGLDGSLTLPCSEPSHTGVYQLVAVNSIGQTEKEVELFVKKEKQPGAERSIKKKVSLSPVPVAEFGNYVSTGHSKDDAIFKEQFTIVDVNPDHPNTIGTHPDTALLNRFANTTVYDNNRIVLVPIEGHTDCQRDFINACYVDGYKCRKKFIATQGPLAETVVDFWRLVWQERPATIVMMTDLKEGKKVKCHKYWPDSGTQLFGPFKVTITDQQRFTDFTSRCFLVELNDGEGRPVKVTQLQYTAWPASGVPGEATSFLAFHRRVKKQHKFPKRPILVHCSGGVGRTGTLIAINRVLDQVLDEKIVDIAGNIRNLRNQRMKMVQLQGQYIFIHDVIVEELMSGDTQIDVVNFRAALLKLNMLDPYKNTTGYEKQFKALERIESHGLTGKSNAGSHKKHRNSVFLESLDGCSTELENEVVYVDGYNQKKVFIITENPTHSTTGDFWKMVYETKCGVIVNLNSSEEIEKGLCHMYWQDSKVMRVGGFFIGPRHIEKLTGFIIRSFDLTPEKSGKAIHKVCQIHVTCWNPDGRCSNLSSIVCAILEMTKYQQKAIGHPVIIHCSDTVGRSGMFCAISTTIERCKTEGVVDVFQVVKALRVQKPGAVTNVLQYKTIYEAVSAYLDSFSNYANF